MDIRQIQALHAQYSSQPVVIDLAGHSAAMPALPAPDRESGGMWRTVATSRLRRVGKPLAICVAIAMLAGGGGMSVAKLWQTMHSHLSAQPSSSAPPVAPPVHAVPSGDMPINVAPPRPLTSADLGGDKSVPTSALANVDVQTLSATALPAPKPVARASDTPPDATTARAAASPIRAQTPATATQPVVAPSPSGQPAQGVAAPPVVQVTHAERPVTQPVTTEAAPSVEAPAKPALRPIHHVSAHRAAKSEDPAPAQPVTQPTASTANPAPATKAPAGPKGGDVQLF